MIDASGEVHVLLTSESRASSSRYEVVIGSTANKDTVLRRIYNGSTEEVARRSNTGHLKGQESRSFWIEVENGHLLFGSGELVMAV